MKNVRRYLGLTLLMFAVMVTSSCIKENLSETNKSETATVTLRVNESRSETTADPGGHEGIKTLRVIVVDKSTNLIEFNFKQDYRDEVNLLTEKTITFMGMTPGEKDFYVVANEESVGRSEGDYPKVGEKLESEEFLKTIVEDASRTSFPKLYEEIQNDGLLITGYKSANIVGDEKIDINIYHAVAKISLSFINNTGMEIPITGFSLGNFLANKTSLSKEGGLLSGIEYSSVSVDKMIIKMIKSGSYENVPENKNLLVFYVYETQAIPSNYTIALTSKSPNVSIGESNQFLETQDILRNNWIQVIATINLNATEITIDFDFEVRKWDAMDIDVPSFS